MLYFNTFNKILKKKLFLKTKTLKTIIAISYFWIDY